jgi:hypothetical protein
VIGEDQFGDRARKCAIATAMMIPELSEPFTQLRNRGDQTLVNG